MWNLTLSEIVLVIVALLGVLVAYLVYAWESRRESKRDLPLLDPGLGGVVQYVAGAVAFLLGLMLLFSVQHFSQAEDAATTEAVAYSAAFDISTVLPTAPSTKVQRDLVCLMRSTISGSWKSASNLDLTGDENTEAWYRRTLDAVDAAVVTGDNDKIALSKLSDELSNSAQHRQTRLLLAEGDLPLVIWIVIFLSIFALCFLVALSLITHPLFMWVSIGSTVVLTGGIIAALVMFAQPFSEPGVTVQPSSLSGVLTRLEHVYPQPSLWEPCPTLAQYVDMSAS